MLILETKSLVKKFDGVHAVDGLSVGIEKGSITAIIGPNGSGKTTLVNVLSGLLPIDAGQVVIHEQTKHKIKPQDLAVLGITRTFQDVRLFNQMTVLDNLMVVLTERNIVGAFFESHTEHHHKIAQEILEKVGLWEKRNHLAVNLSYGQRKLLEIGRTLAMNADVYLFDEPFAGLFPEMVKIIVSVIKELKAAGKTVVLIEHDMNLIRELSDHVLVLESGKLLAEGKPQEVLAMRSVIDAYLGN